MTVTRTPATLSVSLTSSKFFGNRVTSPSYHAARLPRAARQPLSVCVSTGSPNIILQGKNIEVTDSIREYAEEKVQNAIQHSVDAVREVDVRFSARGGASKTTQGVQQQRVEITAYTKQGIVRCEVGDENLYASIDIVSDKLSRKLRKNKEKQRKKSKIKAADLMDSEMPVDLDVDRVPTLPKEVVRTKYIETSPMTVDEACDAMQMVGHDFYTFTNKDTGILNIVYKRDAGGFGLIVPKNEMSK
eukprot:CAMPEP_0197864458 /NCGR_PEP_ID=MMETSP1438-20131217/42715_1 /TAXON_ID=1461541 /ORGANISM="Pterosperma sp., Strain CCMP1384" /LENGTH=244 /DNA_ID=CAMNT_0043482715 /DNA_START=223 /DNA_END=957 /DNA_ORIENTATION=+